MPKMTEYTVIEEGFVMGYVSTNMHGSKCTFPICSVEDWEELSEEEAEAFANDALHESGMLEWGY